MNPFDYGISSAYENLDNAIQSASTKPESRKEVIDAEISKLKSAIDSQRDKFIQEASFDPLLSKKWQAYALLVGQISPEHIEKLQKITGEILHAADSTRLKVTQACAKHGVEFGAYKDFMHDYNKEFGEAINSGRTGWCTPLTYAIFNERSDMVKVLAALGADLNQVDGLGWSPLTVAINNKQLHLVRLLKDLGVNLNQTDSAGIYPIMEALAAKNYRAARLLKTLGADLKQPIQKAKSLQNLELEKLLKLLKARDLNQVDDNGYTPLRRAIVKNQPERVKALVAFGADVDQLDETGWTPLLQAIAKDNLEMVTLLSELEANLLQQNQDGRYPIVIAISNEQYRMAGLLKKLGVDLILPRLQADSETFEVLQLLAKLHQTDSEGVTPLRQAVRDKDFQKIRLLVDLGADINQVSNRWTPLTDAVYLQDYEMVEFLIGLGAKINLRAPSPIWLEEEFCYTHNPLMLAISEEDFEMVRFLKNLGADLNQSSENGLYTPMSMAVKENRYEMVAFLKEIGADPNCASSDETTPLMYAIGNPKMLRLLKKLGVNFNQPARAPYITIAFLENKPESIPLLLELGMDVDQVDNYGRTALICALLWNNDPEAANMLVEAGADREYATVYETSKFLAEVWGIEGTSTYINKKGVTREFPLCEHTSAYTVPKLSKYVDAFFSTQMPKDSPLSEQDRTQIRAAIASALFESSEIDNTMLAHVHAEKSLVIMGGLRGHSISMVICKNKLMVCNRGDGRTENAVEVYELPAKSVTEETIQALKQKYPNIAAFNAMLKSLHLKHIDGYYQKPQEVGNCTLASGKAAVGALCRLFTNNQVGKEIYKALTSFLREKVLEDYFKVLEEYAKTSKTPIEKLLNVELLKRLKEKCDDGDKPGLPQAKKLLYGKAKKLLHDKLLPFVSEAAPEVVKKEPPAAPSLKREMKVEVFSSSSSSSLAAEEQLTIAPLTFVLSKADEEVLAQGTAWLATNAAKINHEVDQPLFNSLLRLSMQGHADALNILKKIGACNMHVSECLGFLFLYGGTNFISDAFKGWQKIHGVKPQELRIKRDVEQAKQWFINAGRLGHVDAWERLGVFHLHGIHGFPQSNDEAIKFFKLTYKGYKEKPPASTPIPEYARYNAAYSLQTAERLPAMVSNALKIDVRTWDD